MIGSHLRRWFHDPLFLMALAAGLIAFVEQSGEHPASAADHPFFLTAELAPEVPLPIAKLSL
jgi:hypothetical protein